MTLLLPKEAQQNVNKLLKEKGKANIVELIIKEAEANATVR